MTVAEPRVSDSLRSADSPHALPDLRPARLTERPAPVPTVVGILFGLWAGLIGVRITVLHVQVPTLFFLIGVVASLLGVVAVPNARAVLVRRRPMLLLDVVMVAYALGRFLIEFGASVVAGHPPSYGRVVSTLYVTVAYLCVRLVVRDRTSLRRFLGVITVPTIPVVGLGALQAAEYGPAVRWVLANTSSLGAANRFTSGRLTRATSTIGHWSSLGGYLCCVVAICMVCIAMDRADGRRPRAWQIVCLAAALVGLATTFTIAPIVVGVVIVLVGAVASRRTLLALSGVFVAAFVVFEFFGTSITDRIALQTGGSGRVGVSSDSTTWIPATLSGRFVIWTNETIPAWLQQPWLGWGHALYDQPTNWPRVPSTIVWQASESEYLKCLVMGGVVELVLFLVLMGVWARAFWQVRNALGTTIRTVLMTLFVGLAVASVVNPYFTNPGLPGLWWPLLGALAWTARVPGGEDATVLAGPELRPAVRVRID